MSIYSLDFWQQLRQQGRTLGDYLEERMEELKQTGKLDDEPDPPQGKEGGDTPKPVDPGKGGDPQGAGGEPSNSLALHRINIKQALKGKYPPKPWIVERFLPEQGLVLVQGLPASRKSLISLYLSICLTTGKRFAGLNTRKANVIYLAYEDEAPVLAERIKRLRESIELNDIQIENLKENCNVFDCVGKLPSLIEDKDGSPHVSITIQNFIQSQLAKDMPNVVIVDTASRALLGINENDNSEMGLTIHALEEFIRKHNICLILIHQLCKSVNDVALYSGRGASVLPASARAVVSLIPITGKDQDKDLLEEYPGSAIVRLEVNKLSHDRPIPNLYFRHTESGYLYPVEVDEKKKRIRIIAEAIYECTKQGQSYFTLDELIEKKNFKSALKRIGIPLREKGKTRALLDEAVKQRLIGVEADDKPGKRGPRAKRYGPAREN